MVSLRRELSSLKEENITLSAQYEKVFDLATIQAAVGDTMIRPTGDQVVYIDLSAPDTVTVYGTDFTRGYPVTSSGAPLTYRPIYIIIKKRSNE